MSYTKSDAWIDLFSRMEACVSTRDVEEAYVISSMCAEMGDLEKAEEYRRYANKWQSEDGYHDALNGN